jgi:hypothetical protein
VSFDIENGYVHLISKMQPDIKEVYYYIENDLIQDSQYQSSRPYIGSSAPDIGMPRVPDALTTVLLPRDIMIKIDCFAFKELICTCWDAICLLRTFEQL